MIVNVGGGVAGGNSYRIALTLADKAEVEATTPAAEKIYRSDGASARIATELALAPQARLFWLPQETLLFDGARLERRLTIDMAGDASLLAVESLVFGRLAMGESRIEASLRNSWRVSRDGRLVFADETRLADAGATLDRRAVGAGARALATVLAAAPKIEARLPELRAALGASSEAVEAGASFSTASSSLGSSRLRLADCAWPSSRPLWRSRAAGRRASGNSLGAEIAHVQRRRPSSGASRHLLAQAGGREMCASSLRARTGIAGERRGEGNRTRGRGGR